ncbi:unnamed protein product [Clonostachys byssicola]|uniref:Xylanolytic transcriptional activator regulatory domain-containing protein n=1 Tax=Clonostachys byssicola TaxID=160290 RepID=A0A9N9Y3L9_9HYPO|nr:unnamed protein product [Clonostachys byssicola]
MPIHVFKNGQANMNCLQGVSAASREKLDALDLAPALVKSVVMPTYRVASRAQIHSSDASPPTPISALLNQPSEHDITSGSAETVDSSTVHKSQLERIRWPSFLSHLRDVFSLDHQDIPDEYPTAAHSTYRPTKLSAVDLSRMRKAANSFPPRHVADFLLKICIQFGTDSFFYFDQDQLLAEVNEFYTDPTSALRYDASFMCLVLSALALGAQRSLPLGLDRDIPTFNFEDGDPGQLFFEQAKFLIPDVIERSCLRAIQATFILGVYLLPQTAVGSSYIYIGIALRKAVSFDLHHPADDFMTTMREREVRRRLWWSIYALERTLTVKLNRSRSINVETITTPLPSPLSPLDSVASFDNVQHQLANAKLVRILDLVAESENASTLDAKSQLADQNARELKQWKRELPPECIPDNIQPNQNSYRAVMHLHMNYYFAWITMGRISLVSLVRTKLRFLFGRDAQPPVLEEGIEIMSRYAMKGATKMLQLFDRLARSGNMVRFSFTDFQACSIATTITLLAGVLERDATYESRVAFAMDCLHKMSLGNSAATSGLKFLDALRSIANEAASRLKQVSPSLSVLILDSPFGGSSSERPGYKEWGEWLSKSVHSTPNVEIDSADDHASTINAARSPRLESWGQRPLNGNWGDDWSYDEAQGISLPSNLGQTYQGEVANLANSYLNDDFFSPYHSEQTFLLGLTGLDVLDFQ